MWRVEQRLVLPAPVGCQSNSCPSLFLPCTLISSRYSPSPLPFFPSPPPLSCRQELGEDVGDLFKYLTGYHRQVGGRVRQVGTVVVQ